jgi:hypothetical protein
MVATPTPTNPADALAGPRAGARHRLEYRVERFPFGDTPSLPAHLEDLLERLNELGRQGWLAVSVDLTDTAIQHSGICHCLEPRLAVLLHREVEE